MTQITISIPTPLRVYTNNQKKIKIDDAVSIKTALDSLIDMFPKLRDHLFEGGEIRNFVNIYLNDEDIRYLESKTQTGLKNGDNLSIIPALAGGA